MPSLYTEPFPARPLFVVSTRVSRRWLRHVTTALSWIDDRPLRQRVDDDARKGRTTISVQPFSRPGQRQPGEHLCHPEGRPAARLRAPRPWSVGRGSADLPGAGVSLRPALAE